MRESSPILSALLNYSITIEELEAASTPSALGKYSKDLTEAEAKALGLINEITAVKAVKIGITASGTSKENTYDTAEEAEADLKKFEIELAEALSRIRKLNGYIDPLSMLKANEDAALTAIADSIEDNNKQVLMKAVQVCLQQAGQVMSAPQLTLKLFPSDITMNRKIYRKTSSDIGSMLLTYTKRGKLMRVAEVIPSLWAYGLNEWWDESGKLRREFWPKING